MEIAGFEVLGDERVGHGGFLVVRRLRVRLVGTGGERTAEGTWDYVERPMGLDAVVVAIYRRAGARVEVLLRSAVRVAVHFGRPETPETPLFTELVAGIVEAGEHGEDALKARAAAEVLEEAGLTVDPQRLERLGPPSFPTPGMCPELFHLFACEVPHGAEAVLPQGDGSPFEEGARLAWVDLDDALLRCGRGELPDMKTELGLRRLRDHVRGR